MLPEKEIEVFLKKVQFSTKDKEAFISKLPRRINTRVKLLKEAIKDL